jgi:nitroreductase
MLAVPFVFVCGQHDPDCTQRQTCTLWIARAGTSADHATPPPQAAVRWWGGEATMDAMELLLSRESALKLEPPGPDRAALDAIFQSAVRAPDHGRLRPWRFVVIQEDKRAAFGDLMADSMQRREPHASAEMLDRERAKAMRAPIIVVAAAHVQKGHKIPEVEQLSAAIAAAQNIMLAANALGYGAMWKTGTPAYDATVKQALGLAPDDDIVGFMYLGKQVGGGIQAPRPAAAEYVSMWEG